MLTIVAHVLAGLIGLAVIAMGITGLLSPKFASGFGIPDTPIEDRAFRSWVAVKAVRDLVPGVFIVILLVASTPQVLGWIMLAATAIPLADALIVLRSKGPRSAAYGVHGATALVMLVTSVLLLLA